MTHRRTFLLFGAAVMLAAGQAPTQNECFRATQREDGSWPATGKAGEPDGDLLVTSIVTLALLGDGSTSRNGPDRNLVKKSTIWLAAQADERGRFGFSTEPGWTLDHAICTCAIAEDTRRSGWRGATFDRRAATLAEACDALARELGVARPPADRELRLWTALIADSIAATCRERADDEKATAARARLRQAVDTLDAARRALPALPAAAAWRDRAIDLLLGDLTGAPPFPVDAPPVAFPEDLVADPLATFYLAAAILRRCAATAPDNAELRHARALLAPLDALVKQRLPHAPGVEPGHAGTWDPVGAFGARNGRIGTSAAATLSVLCYFRCCRLSVTDP